MCFKYYFIAHNGGVKRENGSASKPILSSHKALRHLYFIKHFVICCCILFFIHFLNLCLLENVLLLFLQSSDRFSVYGYSLYLWCSQRYLLDLTPNHWHCTWHNSKETTHVIVHYCVMTTWRYTRLQYAIYCLRW